jgi:cation diffusion facilitator family transporter
MQTREQEIIKTSWIGIIGNSLLSALKITVGLISGSMAVVGDGIDSASDIVTSWITLFTARIISRPPDNKYPYGYAKADTIATIVLGLIIFFAGIQLAISTEMPSMLAVYVTGISILGKYFLSIIHFRIGKRIKSPMLVANGKNMQNDIVISVGVLVGLFFTFILKMPILDKITALLISVWIMRVGYKIFIKTNVELMDGVKDPSIYKKVFKAVSRVDHAHNPHRVRIRHVGNLYIIAIDIEVDGSKSVSDSHEIAKKVENSIKKEVVDVYDVIVHVEPYGNVEKETYGVSDKDI